MLIDLSFIEVLKVCVPAAFALHILEEFVYPGTFPEWYHIYRPHLRGEPRSYYYKANAIYFAMTLTVAFSGDHTSGYVSQLFTSGILLNNLLFTHLRGALKTRSYSPGMITGIALYIPLTATTFWYLTSHGLLSVSAAALTLAGSSVLEVYFALKPKFGAPTPVASR